MSLNLGIIIVGGVCMLAAFLFAVFYSVWAMNNDLRRMDRKDKV